MHWCCVPVPGVNTDNGMNQKLIVGSEEWCALPELGIPAVKARVDSGAKTSSLHAFNIRGFSRDHDQWVSFELHPIQHNRRTTVKCEAPVADKRLVKNTSGISEKRYVIRTMLHLAGESWEIEITLSNRDSMGYRMLLGREAMNDRILVDPSRKLMCGSLSRGQVHEMYGVGSDESDCLNIGILASNPELYSNRRLLEAGLARGHRIQFFDIKQCYIKMDADTPEVHYRGGRILNDMDAVIPRIRSGLTRYGCALVREFESLGVYSLNSSQAIAKSRDRLYAAQLLLKSGLDMPVSGFANSPAEPADLIGMAGGTPLVVKLLNTEQSQGVMLADSDKAAESLITTARSTGVNLMVQEFIREAQGQTLRLLVVDNKVVAAIQRQAARGEFHVNLRSGGHHSKIRITPAERKLAVKAVRTLGLRVAGVDIIRSRRGPLLLDVSSAPALESVEQVTGKDVAMMMIGLVEKKLGFSKVETA